MAFQNNPEPSDEMQPLAEINVTPFIDVMLVLLIIFMVTAPMLASGIKVELPKASSAPQLDQPKPVVVTVEAEGRITVMDRAVSKEEVAPAVRAELAGEDRPIHVRGDARTPYGDIVAVMDQLSAGNLPKFVLAFERKKRAEP